MAVALTAFVPHLIQTLHGFIEEDAVLRLGAIDAIRALLKNLEMARDLLPSAESRVRSERAVRQWLKDLREIVYDCDLLDDCKLEIDKRKLLPESVRLPACLAVKSRLSWFSCFSKSASRHEIGGKINSLNARLEQTIEDASKLQLQRSIGQAIEFPRRVNSSNCTPLPGSKTIAGTQLEQDARSLVKLLIQDNPRFFFAITGVGGIGKTTLARRIHDDERIRAHFHVRIWVCVSQQFTDVNILREFISGAGAAHREAQTREQLEHIARTCLQHKKFLLVLDDVWSSHVCENLLQISLGSNAAGNRILTTTRNEAVARELPGVHLHRMKILPAGDGWSLLSEKVFHSAEEEEEEEEEMDELRDLGLGIVRKCKGLPLAINTVAGVLRSKGRSSQQWRRVLGDPAWSSPELPDNIMRALYLGYQDLPSHVKQCFVYCSLFPDDHVFDKMHLIQYWIAEGLVEAKEDVRMEDTAESYYSELIWRNLLEPVDHRGGVDDRCKIHGLLRFLAYFVAAEENSVGSLSSLSTASSSTKTRRLSTASRCLASIPCEIKRQEALRTLFLFKNPVKTIADELFDGMRSLRVLDIHGTDIESLPSSIAILKHLRLLNVSYTRLRSLPEIIEQLKNLHFLSVRGCELLEYLPTSLVNLRNLRSLDIVGTRIDGMPSGVGRLENMNLLLGFVVKNGGGSCTFELGAMSQLIFLSVHKLERVPNGPEAAKARLISKQHLKTFAELVRE